MMKKDVLIFYAALLWEGVGAGLLLLRIGYVVANIIGVWA